MFTDVDMSKLHFHPLKTQGKAKVVDISHSKDSTSWVNRLVIQLATDTKPLNAAWALSKPKDDDDSDGTKRMWQLELNEDLLEKFEEIDNFMIEYGVTNAREIWKKDLKREQVEDRYTPLIKRKDGEEPSILIKVKCPPADWPTQIRKVDNDWTTYAPGTIDDLTKNAKVVPIVKTLGLWFAMDKFGMSLQADKMLVSPVPKVEFLDNFILNNELTAESKTKTESYEEE